MMLKDQSTPLKFTPALDQSSQDQAPAIFASPGKSYPIGASFPKNSKKNYVNFSLYSREASKVTLNIYRNSEDKEPLKSFILDPKVHKQGHYWCIRIHGISQGYCYTYQVDGPWNPKKGQRFDAKKLLIDPYSTAIAISKDYDLNNPNLDRVNMTGYMKSVITKQDFDWQHVKAPNHSLSETLIYEMHVAGFTSHPNSGVSEEKRGTFAGIIEKIPYLKSLGITAIELLPIQQFDILDAPLGRKNYWGYSPINFFSVHSEYSVNKDPISAINEFKTLVRELHRNDIEIFLDVVFNHTSEGDEYGPTYCFKGLENNDYYMLDKQGNYTNYSGCGNTCNANHSVFRAMVIDALNYWVTEMHVDGFRFDLASVLSRDTSGRPLAEPPLLLSIDTSPILSRTKIIAEAWDAAGLYQVGSFIGDRWHEWNGKYRDDIRAFWRGDNGKVSALASRILGSPDIYHAYNHSPHRSVNFISAHDGFTLNDLVSYQEKHNLENGENNRDGENHNLSANYGVEGPSNDPMIEDLRHRQCKNMLATLFLSLGLPMLNMGDEVRRTQKGNNNAYCQDNEISWFDWSLVEKDTSLIRFVSLLQDIRLTYLSLDWEIHRSLGDVLSKVDISWHGTDGEADWSENSHSLALRATHPHTGDDVYVIFNAYWLPLEFKLPKCRHDHWHIIVNTANPSPKDICLYDDAEIVLEDKILVKDHSFVFLTAKTK